MITTQFIIHKLVNQYVLTYQMIGPRAQSPTISTVEQHEKEPLLDYLDRFQELLYRCPNHQFSEDNLVIQFCDGLLPDDADHLDASANGSITKLDAETAWELIKEVAVRNYHRRRIKEDKVEAMEQLIGEVEELKAE